MIEINPIQRHLFLEGIFLRYGYDFRQYSEASLNRRLSALLTSQQKSSLIDVLGRALESVESFREMLPFLTINTTEFFRDPLFFREIREVILPILSTYPSIRIWSAGCSTGEEVLSLNILLSEAGLLSRSTVYATDVNPNIIKRAKKGIFDSSSMQMFAKNYAAASGLRSPSEYYTAEYDLVRFDPKLMENVVFSEHNLATDSVFVEAHLILCRNVMIYFTRELQARVIDLFQHSLAHGGFLGLGSKESLRLSPAAKNFSALDFRSTLYQIKPASVEKKNFGGFA